jgi:hypothetical protein
VGGDFSNVGGALRDFVAALDPVSGLATDWNPDANRAVHAVAAARYNIYVGGEFATIGGEYRNYVAGISPWTGKATSWTPSQSEYVGRRIGAIELDTDVVYVGGNFSYFGNSLQSGFAAIEKTLASSPETLAPSTSALRLRSSPNPFNAQTMIRFELPGALPFVLRIYDAAGRRVAEIRGLGKPGTNSVRWDAQGGELASGVYLARVETGGDAGTHRMVLVK